MVGVLGGGDVFFLIIFFFIKKKRLTSFPGRRKTLRRGIAILSR